MSRRNEEDKKTALARATQVRRRTVDAHVRPTMPAVRTYLAYTHDDAGNEAAVYGTPDQVAEKMDALRRAGVHYVLASFGGNSRVSLRRFAREIAPAFV